MNRALDEQCARLLGWRPSDAVSGMWDTPFGLLEADAMPRYSSCPIAASLLEDEIEQRGLQSEYIDALMGLAVSDPDDIFWIDPSGVQVWALIRATPEQKARAFLKAIEDSHAHT